VIDSHRACPGESRGMSALTIQCSEDKKYETAEAMSTCINDEFKLG